MRRLLPPAPAPSPSPAAPEFLLPSSPSVTNSESKAPVEFSPPLIAMVVVIIAAFIAIAYSRMLSRHFLLIHRRYLQWRLRRRRYVPSSSASNFDSPTYPFGPADAAYHVFSPYGLDDTAIKTIPLSVHTRKSGVLECAVCLLEFEDDDYVRTLPVCSHAFHVDCIDIWLKSHANCPLCRATIFRPESPFIPVMATRIRPSLDDIILENTILEPLTEIVLESESVTDGEITQEASPSPGRSAQFSECNRPDFLLKRSYSFGFERNLGSERLVMEAVTASPWRYRRSVGSFWNKRPSPFSSLTKPRVFSFRYYKGMNMKSPFFRRRLNPLSERYGGSTSAGGGGSSRRSNKSFASPMFLRGSGGVFTSSRHRSGDPEALLSPDRYSKR